MASPAGPPASSLPGPRPLAELACARLAAVAGVLTDIDDTLTDHGELLAPARGALDALAAAGVPVVAITGRPLGWSEPFARQWPVAAIVAENGAVALVPDPGQPQGLRVAFAQDAATRARHAVRLREVAQRVLAEVPGATLARDSAGRVTDIAIDHSEFSRLQMPAIERVVALMREEGMIATVSSIHVNGWFGAHTKLSGARWMVRELFGRDLDPERERWIYVGDSTNDQLMFGHFPLSVGVANVHDFADRLQTWPNYVTCWPRGRGFAEVAQALLAARGMAAAATLA
ncbi:MAG: HAD-IIB family hydrolase [Rubrivivax sp.]